MYKLLINTGVFNTPLRKIVNRGLLPIDNPLDVFKYMISSIGVFSHIFEQAIIRIELESCFNDRESELFEWIKQEIKCPLIYTNYRNSTQEQWQKECETIEDEDFICYFGNHDHIFIDSSLITLVRSLESLKKFKDYKTLYLSHWSQKLGAITDINNNIGYYYYNECDSVNFVSGNLFRYWWNNRKYTEEQWRRTDELHYCVDSPMVYIVVPKRELFRHYDGYEQYNRCPALIIPPGFFENNIKIRYGYNNRISDWININPLYPNYLDVDINGMDLRTSITDVPLCWQDKISEIDFNSKLSISKAEFESYRNLLSLAICCPASLETRQKIINYIQT